MKYRYQWLCMVILLMLCMGATSFWHLYTRTGGSICYVEWERAAIVEHGEAVSVLDPSDFAPPALEPEQEYRYEVSLTSWPASAMLTYEVSGGSCTLLMDGELVCHSETPAVNREIGLSSLSAPLPADKKSCEIVLLWRPAGEAFPIMPPLLRIASVYEADTDAIAYANWYGFATGALLLAAMMLCALFVLSVFFRKPDWPLPVLASAILLGAVQQLSIYNNNIYMPESLVNVLVQPLVAFLALLLMIAYTLLNHRCRYDRYLLQITAVSLVLFGACCGLSALFGGKLHARVMDILTAAVADGYTNQLTFYLQFWLGLSCTGIAFYGYVKGIVSLQAEANALALRNRLTLEGYRALEANISQTAQLRHEIKHQLMALSLLYERGDTQALGRLLEKLSHQQATIAQVQFCEHFAVNAILQNAAASAARQETRFTADVYAPENLPIPEDDLCGLLLNMLDNALEACQKVEPSQRRIQFHAHTKQGHWAIGCRNSYDGRLLRDESGHILSCKGDAIHGLGLRRMEEIAARYGGTLVIDPSEDSFFVCTALEISKKEPVMPAPQAPAEG